MGVYATMDRRRLQRTRASTRHALERALGSWLRLRGSWQSILEVARAGENWERMALAEAKLFECQGQIVRIETLLAGPESAT
jgi:hypothetical protein